MNWIVVKDADEMSEQAAQRVLAQLDADPRSVLCLPTGRTPLGMYEHLVAHCSREYHCFRDVTTFNLDEYVGIDAEHPGSYRAYMKENLFRHVDLDPSRTHLPDGTARQARESHPHLPESELLAIECARFEEEIRAAGGIDLTILGLGTNGHIAFNEPGTPHDSRTHVIELTPSTRAANAPEFAGGQVPTHAITMGIGTILESRRIILLASGPKKRDAIARLRSGEVSVAFPASALHSHPDVTVIVTEDAA